jgi:hypothetical protein
MGKYLTISTSGLILSLVALLFPPGATARPPRGACLSAEEVAAVREQASRSDTCEWFICTYQCQLVQCTGECLSSCDWWICGGGCTEVGCALPT